MTLTKLEPVTVELKANIYFEGRVVSHTIHDQGIKKTVGLIYPGTYLFNTGAPEQMIITAGHCEVKQKGAPNWTPYTTGTEFNVPSQSSFEIKVTEGIAEYLCVFKQLT